MKSSIPGFPRKNDLVATNAARGTRATSRASSRVVSCSSERATTWFTRPMRSASSAVMVRPVRHSSRAQPSPTTERSGVKRGGPPRRISGCPNVASSLATRRSHMTARSMLVPTACPWTIAIDGMRSPKSSRWNVLDANWSVRRSSADSDWIQSRSSPAPKLGPSALNTTTLTSVPCDQCRKQVTISASISGDRALRRSGRFRVNQPIRSETSARIAVNAGSAPGWSCVLMPGVLARVPDRWLTCVSRFWCGDPSAPFRVAA